jgi:hypothetical protein
MIESEKDRAIELLRAAKTGAAVCLCHGHRFDGGTGRVPVVVKRPGGNLEVFCRGCAEHYDEKIVREGE